MSKWVSSDCPTRCNQHHGICKNGLFSVMLL